VSRWLLALPLCLLFAPRPPAAGPALRSLADVSPADAADLPTPGQLERLARSDVIAFLRACLARYQRDVHGYRATLQKQERLGGKLGPVEVLDVAFREEPFSVLLRWRGPSAGLHDRVLYAAGQNGGQALARGKILGLVHSRDPYSPDARAAGRYPLPEFGLRWGTVRTLTAWQAAQGRGNLQVEYLGKRRVAEAGNAECYVLRRSMDPPEDDGVAVAEVAFDTEHWLQVANVLTAPGGGLVAAYYFRDIVLNPEFPPGQFERAALTRD
jgi:hypothetical protein